jgi:hypothetical protein
MFICDKNFTFQTAHLHPRTRPVEMVLLKYVRLILSLLSSPAVWWAGSLVAHFKSVLGDSDVLLDLVAAPRAVVNFTS